MGIFDVKIASWENKYDVVFVDVGRLICPAMKYKIAEILDVDATLFDTVTSRFDFDDIRETEIPHFIYHINREIVRYINVHKGDTKVNVLDIICKEIGNDSPRIFNYYD